jgi:phospholipid/cholesterol/gamma-HCH transport system substrate-binding protein
MTITIDRPPPGPPPLGPGGSPPPPDRGRLSVEALQESRTARALMGVLLVALILGAIYVIVLTFSGHFTNIDRLKAVLPANSNAVTISAPVEYLHVTVGKVGSETAGPDGTTAVELEIYPRFLPKIPKGVQAEVEPLSIFGNQYVNLVAPATAIRGHLEVRDFISAFRAAPSSSLQGSVTQLYNLLTAIHPQQLDEALTAFATALNHEGQNLGQTLAGASDYLKPIVPLLDTANSDIKQLTPATKTVNDASPNIVGTLANSSVTAQTIMEEKNALESLLQQGSASIGRFADVLSQVQNDLPSLLNESGPLLNDITQSPTELSQTLSGLTQFASAVAAAETQGPFLAVNTNLPVADISAGVNAALGYDNPASLNAALGGTVNPPTYTSANCPQYPGITNPYCGTGGNPDATPLGPAAEQVTPLAVPQSAASRPSQTAPGRASAASAAAGTQPSGEAMSSAGTSSSAAASGSPSAASDPGGAMVAASSTDPYLAELDAVQAIAAAVNGGQPPADPALAEMVLLPLLSSMASQP